MMVPSSPSTFRSDLPTLLRYFLTSALTSEVTQVERKVPGNYVPGLCLSPACPRVSCSRLFQLIFFFSYMIGRARITEMGKLYNVGEVEPILYICFWDFYIFLLFGSQFIMLSECFHYTLVIKMMTLTISAQVCFLPPHPNFQFHFSC